MFGNVSHIDGNHDMNKRQRREYDHECSTRRSSVIRVRHGNSNVHSRRASDRSHQIILRFQLSDADRYSQSRSRECDISESEKLRGYRLGIRAEKEGRKRTRGTYMFDKMKALKRFFLDRPRVDFSPDSASCLSPI